MEYLRRFRPGLKVCVYHGVGRALDEAADVTLTTYALLRLDAAQLGGRDWDAVVLDEAQAIKNPDSQVARAAYGLRAGFRLALTGTPLENRLEELWSLLHFANRGLLGSRAQLGCAWIEGAQWAESGIGAARQSAAAWIKPVIPAQRVASAWSTSTAPRSTIRRK
jgi:hypothetical protein